MSDRKQLVLIDSPAKKIVASARNARSEKGSEDGSLALPQRTKNSVAEKGGKIFGEDILRKWREDIFGEDVLRKWREGEIFVHSHSGPCSSCTMCCSITMAPAASLAAVAGRRKASGVINA
jgi:hypothetical protein